MSRMWIIFLIFACGFSSAAPLESDFLGNQAKLNAVYGEYQSVWDGAYLRDQKTGLDGDKAIAAIDRLEGHGFMKCVHRLPTKEAVRWMDYSDIFPAKNRVLLSDLGESHCPVRCRTFSA